eukprot:TRINITY_DN19999_c0_g1_i1.p1 TRINITY_DN19999_c0_g1~~TRINITY_DN19999_c0_g1_i1.p1  ORF type:complete len:560 (-),score=92.18 TRINITY_DN19999_c0_g1_i1:82-1734(-)
MPTRPKKTCLGKPQDSWFALAPQERSRRMTFDEAKLLENIDASSHLIHMRQIISGEWSRPRGLGADDVAAALASAALFTSGFELVWNSLLSRTILRMKVDFAERRDIFDLVRAVLPDLFCSRRQAMHRARWKDLWEDKPTSINEFELALAKLMEQAFWAIATDACPAVAAVAVSDPILPEVLSDGWMSDSGIQMQKSGQIKSKKKNKGTKHVVDTKGKGTENVVQSQQTSSGKSTSLQDKEGCRQRQAVASELRNEDVLESRRQPSATPSDAARKCKTLARQQTLNVRVQPKRSEATTSKANIVESVKQVTQSEKTAAKATVQLPESFKQIGLPTKLPGDEREHVQYFPCIVPMEQWSSMVDSGAVPIAQVSQEQASQLASGSLSLDTFLSGGHMFRDETSVGCLPPADQLKQEKDGRNQICAGSSDDVDSVMGEPESGCIHDDSSTCSGVSSLYEFSISQSPMSTSTEKACLGVHSETAFFQQQTNISGYGCRLQQSHKIFVKNTFIDLQDDDCISKASFKARARSWSPSLSFNISAGPFMLDHSTETS